MDVHDATHRVPSLATRCMTDAGAPEGRCGLVFGYASDARHLVAFVDARAGRIALARIDAGVVEELGSLRTDIGSDAWNELRVRTDGTR